MFIVASRAIIVKTASDFIFASYYIKAKDWGWIVRVWKDATVHHP
jgi:hypothetical protein